ncbi:hypothetical protein [Azohydromonas australica]|uniref:hypothetical protein n=1 Tax=Azohydromonas australica TaxID=364039 RepID=UPI0004135C75|nr:hypothetical protein [Azohydromonas australica]
MTTSFGSKAGQLRYSAGIVSINADEDAEAEFQIQLIGNVPAALSVSDFML